MPHEFLGHVFSLSIIGYSPMDAVFETVYTVVEDNNQCSQGLQLAVTINNIGRHLHHALICHNHYAICTCVHVY